MDTNKSKVVLSLKTCYESEVSQMDSAVQVELYTKRFKADRLKEGYTDEDIAVMIGESVDYYDEPIGVVFDAWEFDKSTGAIWRNDNKGGIHIACTHPIWIERKLLNALTGELKVEIAFRTSKKARSDTKVIVPIEVITTNASIVKLANFGVSVTSSNARNLVTFLQGYENAHRADIPVQKSINRFGWVGSEFMPYTNDYIFDGNGQYDDLLDAIKPNGSYSEWLDLMRTIRAKDATIEPKILLATSFASALVQPLQCLPFFSHIWGGTEAGKTVALMVATSVWGNPTIGKLAKSFNSTAVAQETLAGTLYSIPLVLDELQSIRNQRDFDKMIYELTEGTGRARGMANGGLRQNYTWANCMITSGEQPITRDMSGGGAKNRIIEIECTGRLFKDPIETVETVKANYGFAGRKFVESLTPEVIERARSRRLELFRSFARCDYTEKQSMSASLIAVAEELIAELIFHDEPSFSHYDLMNYMKKASEVSKEVQAWGWFKEWIIENRDYFNGFTRENWGKENDDYIMIISSVFSRECEKAGISPRTLVSYMKQNEYLRIAPDGKTSVVTKLDGISSRCYQVKISALSDK